MNNATKTIPQILRDNICTVFNALNLMIAVALAAVGAWKNILFIFIILINTVVGIVQEIKAKRQIERLTLLAQPVVTVLRGGEETTIRPEEIRTGDVLVLTGGSAICTDCVLQEGRLEVNESILTGESEPVVKLPGDKLLSGSSVIAGRCLAQAECGVDECFTAQMVDEVKKTKSARSELLASMKKVTKFTSFLIVPLGALLFVQAFFVRGAAVDAAVVATSAGLLGMLPKGLVLLISIGLAVGVIRLSKKNVLVRDLHSLENLAHCDVVCLDKTGTLTAACPRVEEVLDFTGRGEDELLRCAACIEEHFPHSMARAVTRAAEERGLNHEERHAEVEYVVAHGVATTLEGERALIGSRHFIFEDEGVACTDEQAGRIAAAARGRSVLYLAIGGRLAGVLLISDPPRPEAAEAIAALRALGVRRVIMLTGDQETAARAVCERLGIDTFRAQVLPADKASLIEGYKEGGSRLIMVGDGVNDSPALAAADVSVAMRDASDLAREVADITLLSSDLRELAALRRLSQRMLERINRNYRSILTINTSLLALGIFGILPPTTTALLHNASTMAISAASMRPYLPAPGGRGAQGKEPGNETA